MVRIVIYLLLILASCGCTWLLFRAWRRTHSTLLFWSALCFGGFALNHFLVFVDLVVLPTSVDLVPFRQAANLAAIGVLLWGFIWESD
jgi:hypothetical protein